MVSVIVVTYNSSKTILETLKSIENQNYSNYEVIISDDASKDDTIKICEDWKEKNKDKNIKIINSEVNKGVTINLNNGLKYSEGEYIKFIAGDDILFENCLKDYVEYFESNKEIGVCFSKIQNFTREKQLDISPDSKFGEKIMSLTSTEQYKEMLIGNFISAPSVFFRKEILEKYNYFDERIPMTEDFPFWLKITKNGEKIYFLDRVTVGYRKEESLSNKEYSITNYSYFKAREQVWDYYLKDNVSIIFKWHFLLDMKMEKFLSIIFKNKRNIISDFIIRYIKILDPVFIIRKIKRDILWRI